MLKENNKINTMEEDFNKSKPSVAAPPPPEITIRTMESDVKALEQGGGEMIAPRPFVLPQSRDKESNVEINLDIPGYAGPEKPIFDPTESTEAPDDKKTDKWKIAGIIIGIAIIILGLGLLGYFITSVLFSKEMPAAQ